MQADKQGGAVVSFVLFCLGLGYIIGAQSLHL